MNLVYVSKLKVDDVVYLGPSTKTTSTYFRVVSKRWRPEVQRFEMVLFCDRFGHVGSTYPTSRKFALKE